jgi:DNA-binding MarR family transcriptional regulator
MRNDLRTPTTRRDQKGREGALDAAGSAPDDVSRLRMVLLRLARRLRQQVHTGITPSQLSALSAIENHGPLTLGELATLENVQPPSISRIVGALEGEGYVDRAPDAKDRRVALVRVTTKGRRELSQIRSERDAWLRDQLRQLGVHERDCLSSAIPILESLLVESPDQPA